MLNFRDYAPMGKKVMALLLSPIIGLVFVVFLPFISIAAFIFIIGEKAFGKVWGALKSLVYFGWRPSEAYLEGKKKKKIKNG